VVGEAVDDNVAGADPGGEDGSGRAVHITFHALELEDRPGRHQDALGLSGGNGVEAAERRIGLLQPGQIGLAQQRQFRERLA
jgi:hypothetical protein